MEVSEVRRRVRAAIESARKNTQDRRARSDQAARDYETFLRDTAVPVFHVVAAALVAEGHRFKVFTPAESVRLASESSADDYIELTLDPSTDPPAVMVRISRGRGRRLVSEEKLVRDGAPAASLTDEDVLAVLTAEIAPLVER